MDHEQNIGILQYSRCHNQRFAHPAAPICILDRQGKWIGPGLGIDVLNGETIHLDTIAKIPMCLQLALWVARVEGSQGVQLERDSWL